MSKLTNHDQILAGLIMGRKGASSQNGTWIQRQADGCSDTKVDNNFTFGHQAR
jgi:hypothetical protein